MAEIKALTPDEMRAKIKAEIADIDHKADEQIKVLKACIEQVQKLRDHHIAAIRKVCPHKDNGGFLTGFCVGCGFRYR